MDLTPFAWLAVGFVLDLGILGLWFLKERGVL